MVLEYWNDEVHEYVDASKVSANGLIVTYKLSENGIDYNLSTDNYNAIKIWLGNKAYTIKNED